MSLAQPSDRNTPYALIALVRMLLLITTPAFYAASPVAWRRFMLSGCIIIVWVVVLKWVAVIR